VRIIRKKQEFFSSMLIFLRGFGIGFAAGGEKRRVVAILAGDFGNCKRIVEN
jgi:hypothetical protein